MTMHPSIRACAGPNPTHTCIPIYNNPMHGSLCHTARTKLTCHKTCCAHTPRKQIKGYHDICFALVLTIKIIVLGQLLRGRGPTKCFLRHIPPLGAIALMNQLTIGKRKHQKGNKSKERTKDPRSRVGQEEEGVKSSPRALFPQQCSDRPMPPSHSHAAFFPPPLALLTEAKLPSPASAHSHYASQA